MTYLLCANYTGEPEKYYYIGKFETKKQALQARGWQVRGGFRVDRYLIATPDRERRVLVNIEDENERFTLERGFMMEDAFNDMIDDLFGIAP